MYISAVYIITHTVLQSNVAALTQSVIATWFKFTRGTTSGIQIFFQNCFQLWESTHSKVQTSMGFLVHVVTQNRSAVSYDDEDVARSHQEVCTGSLN